MQKVVRHDKYGEITYDESFWVGRKSVSINGTPLKKINRKTFETADGQQVVVKGNYVYGVKLLIGGETIQVTPTVKWYEIVLSLLPFIFNMSWGNSEYLCGILPVIGGAIGGLIGGAAMALSLMLMRRFDKVGWKIGASMAVFAAAFGISVGIGFAFVSVLYH